MANEDIPSWKMLIFIVANCYFVFQGVILTIVGHGAQNLKPSSSCFLFTVSMLAVLVNLFAFILIAFKYMDAKVSPDNVSPDNSASVSQDNSAKVSQDRCLYVIIYAVIYIIIFQGFAAVVLVG
ncbi:hypothetical protein FCV25MIE_09052 [Fagus crenata]